MSLAPHPYRFLPALLSLAAASACASEAPSRAHEDAPPAPLAVEYASTRSAAPFGCAGSKIALSTKSGFYVGAFFGGGFGMIATARTVGEPETFRSIDLGSSRVALQASSGHYVAAENGGGGSVYANQQKLSAATAFILDSHWDDQSITLRTPSNWFLSALLGGGTVMNTNTRAAGDWEALRVKCLEGALDDAEQPDDSDWPDDSDQSGDSEQPSDSDWPGDADDVASADKPGLGG